MTSFCALICRDLPDSSPGSREFPYTRQCSRSQQTSIILSTRARTKLLNPAALMSNSNFITAAPSGSSSNFQLIFNNALKAYEKRTKKDLLAHPLAAELQKCNSPTAILAVLHQQVQGLDRSQTSDDRWTKWLDPTVNVLHTLSETIGEGVSLVGFKTWTRLTLQSQTYSAGFLTWKGDICRCWGSPFSTNSF